jgi:serine/threonine-protein kinase HipA
VTAPVYVWSDLAGAPRLVGATALAPPAGEFRYAPDFIASAAPAIDPINLPVDAAAFTTLANRGVFGVLADAGPDAWGRRVLAALHPRRMANASGLDVLLMSSGHGAGALLFSKSRDQVHARRSGIALADLGAAAEGAQQIEVGDVLRAQVRQLMDFGSSLGGLHPKVAVTDEEGIDWIAKFRSREDTVDTPRLEWATMRLAAECGIAAAAVELTAVGERSALLVRRFDRIKGATLHYASAHALWNRERATESDALGWASYAGIVRLLRQLPGADVRRDAGELFRRLAFNVIVGNTDDHGRNHGFLMNAGGAWRLAPAFDVLPSVGSVGAAQAIGAGPAGRERTLENVLAGAAHFGLDQAAARSIVTDMGGIVERRFAALLREARAPAADREAALARGLR